MTTYVGARARRGTNAHAVGWAGVKNTAFGTVTFGADQNPPTATLTDGPKAGDVYHLAKVPKGAVIVGGRIFGGKVASGTSAGCTLLQWAIGLPGPFRGGDGTSYSTYASGASALGLVSVNNDAVCGLHPAGALNYNLAGLLYSTGPITILDDQVVVVQSVVSATSFISASVLSVEVDYYMGTHV
jgi:hypothetical protein